MQLRVLLADAGLVGGDLLARTGLADLDRVDVRPAPGWMRRLWRGPVAAMTLGRRVFVAPHVLAGDPHRLMCLMIHECCHVRQWQQAGPLRFVARYVGDYLRGRLAGLDHLSAYRAIRYEAEARRLAGC